MEQGRVEGWIANTESNSTNTTHPRNTINRNAGLEGTQIVLGFRC
jgi:hypothetical protein